MPRKFISFLGAIPYKEAVYFFDTDRKVMASPTPYVQVAILEKGMPEWNPENDEVWVFTTEDAYTNNYQNRILYFDREAGKPQLDAENGLQNALAQLQAQGQIGHFESDRIPNGNSEQEIWQVFSKVLQHINPEDEVYLDITYGFRSLPMLGLVLLNYARTLKKVEVKAIFYGNYEAGRAERQQNPDQSGPIEAPVINLQPFAELQEWTYAARTFLELGNAEPLAALTDDPNANLKRELLSFSRALMTCRGKALSQNIDIDLLKRIVSINPSQFNIEEQLRPLLSNIQQKIEPFQTGEVRNGFAAVEWCIQHGMIQQGITFLQETLISLVIDETIGKKFLNTYLFRQAAGRALNGAKNLRSVFIQRNRKKIKLSDESISEISNQMVNWVTGKPGLSKQYRRMTGGEGFRNDINHAGFTDRAKTPEQLRDDLIDLYNNIKEFNL